MLAPGSEEPRLLHWKKSPTDEEAFATSNLDGCEVRQCASVRPHTWARLDRKASLTLRSGWCSGREGGALWWWDGSTRRVWAAPQPRECAPGAR